MLEYVSLVDRILTWAEKSIGWFRKKKPEKPLLENFRDPDQIHRRREILTKLIEFNKLIGPIPDGVNWPGTDSDGIKAWSNLGSQIRHLRSDVIDCMDLDRETAGRVWCLEVELTLEKGYHLFLHYYQMSGAFIFISNKKRKELVATFGKAIRAYNEAYESVVKR